MSLLICSMSDWHPCQGRTLILVEGAPKAFPAWLPPSGLFKVQVPHLICVQTQFHTKNQPQKTAGKSPQHSASDFRNEKRLCACACACARMCTPLSGADEF